MMLISFSKLVHSTHLNASFENIRDIHKYPSNVLVASQFDDIGNGNVLVDIRIGIRIDRSEHLIITKSKRYDYKYERLEYYCAVFIRVTNLLSAMLIARPHS